MRRAASDRGRLDRDDDDDDMRRRCGGANVRYDAMRSTEPDAIALLPQAAEEVSSRFVSITYRILQ